MKHSYIFEAGAFGCGGSVVVKLTKEEAEVVTKVCDAFNDAPENQYSSCPVLELRRQEDAMNQLQQAHEIRERLWEKVHDLVDAELEGVDAAVAEYVRDEMTQTFRFWKRMAL